MKKTYEELEEENKQLREITRSLLELLKKSQNVSKELLATNVELISELGKESVKLS